MKTKITKEIIAHHRLTEDEYALIVSLIGREPNYLELGLFSAMWSEHCSYKSSRVHLKNLPTKGKHILQGPGENAGIIDIGDGLAAVFKIESHNHPSFIEPYNGSATGVGGILRDIFTMGARPVAVMNSLRFGAVDNERTKYLVKGVVSGISDYGNRVGVPDVGGEVYFDSCYNGNNLVNAFALGILDKDKIFKGVAEGVGNLVIYAGSKTGRDGIHGASMASEEFNEKTEEKRPNVQVGDPFTEKLLIEACLDLMKTDYITGIQDMGAAGLTCSTVEMAGRAGNGIELCLDKVPAREKGMTPYEFMLSESQERMLITAKKGCEGKVIDIFKRYDLDAEVVGKVTDNGRIVIYFNKETVADLPIDPLTNHTPVYNRPYDIPSYKEELNRLDIRAINNPDDYNAVFLKMISSLNNASKRWVYSQYDHIVMTNTVVRPGSDAAVIRIKGTDKGIAMSCDCNSRYAYLDPYLGGMAAVAESARNVACSGATPMAVTDCLNFGNPEKKEVMWQFVEALRGIKDACIALDTPVVGGNVSLYNETNNVSIYPTPVVTMVGMIDDYKNACTQYFKNAGDAIILLGDNKDEIGGSEYLYLIHSQTKGMPPLIDLEQEKRLHKVCISGIASGVIKSAHDCSDGGIALTLFECCISGDKILGADISLDDDIRGDSLLFSESHSRAIITVDKNDIPYILNLSKGIGINAKVVGRVSSEELLIVKNRGNTILNIPLNEYARIWGEAFQRFME